MMGFTRNPYMANRKAEFNSYYLGFVLDGKHYAVEVVVPWRASPQEEIEKIANGWRELARAMPPVGTSR